MLFTSPLQSAVSTAGSIAPWAARAVQRLVHSQSGGVATAGAPPAEVRAAAAAPAPVPAPAAVGVPVPVPTPALAVPALARAAAQVAKDSTGAAAREAGSAASRVVPLPSESLTAAPTSATAALRDAAVAATSAAAPLRSATAAVPVLAASPAPAASTAAAAPHGRLHGAAAKPAAEPESPVALVFNPTASSTSAAAASFDRREEALRREQRELSHLYRQQSRDSAVVTQEMTEEVMALLRLLGVPYVVSPSEAEAQCVALEQLGLVDGVVTNDCDAFLFGGSTIYKHIFNEDKFVEVYTAADVQTKLKLVRSDLINMGLLLGTDYTDGVKGIGPVNATEIVLAWRGAEGLSRYSEWMNTCSQPDEIDRMLAQKRASDQAGGGGEADAGVEEGKRGTRTRKGGNAKKEKARSKLSKTEIKALSKEQLYKYTHRTTRQRWAVPRDYPSPLLRNAYLSPTVDKTLHAFSWQQPSTRALAEYCSAKFGWAVDYAAAFVERALGGSTGAAKGADPAQRKMESYFMRFEANITAPAPRSKRLRAAFNIEDSSSDDAVAETADERQVEEEEEEETRGGGRGQG